MTLKETINDFSHKLHAAANRTADTVEQTANFILEHNPLQMEVSLLQKAARNLPTLDNPKDVKKIDEDLQKCGLLPHVHIGLDDNSNLTVKIDKTDKTDCFGYMHAPGFWDRVMHGEGKESNNINPGDFSGNGIKHDAALGADILTPAAKHVADTVIDRVGEMVKSLGVSADPRI